MDLKIIQEIKNPLFNRKEIQGIIKADFPPSRAEAAKALSEKYSVPSDAIRVLEIKGKFGVKEFNLKATVYSTKEERDKLETMSKKEKDMEAKALAPAETPKEAA